MSVPKLRFKDEDGRDFPEWEISNLGELFDITSSKRVFQSEWTSSGVPFYRAREVIKLGENGFVDNELFITEEMYRQYQEKYGVPKEDDLLVTGVGTIGKLYVVRGCDKFYFKDGNIIWFKSLGRVRSQYVKQLFQTRIVLDQIESNASITTVGTYTIENAKKTSIPLPCELEQTKIASFLTAVDEKISQLTKKCNLLIQYKKGVMQKIFNQELRFKDDDGQDYSEWESVTLSTLGDSFNGLTGKSGDDFGEGKPYITYKQIFDDSIIDLAKCSFVRIDSNEKQSVVKFGDVFFTTSSETPEEVGYCSVLLTNVEEVYLNSFCFGFRINSFSKFNPRFARFVFTSPNFRREVIKLAQGSTRYNISKSRFMEISIQLPTSEEQSKIANFLSAIDDKIAATQSQLNAVKQYKQGLLQQMFV